jgi:transcriptional activator SPT8
MFCFFEKISIDDDNNIEEPSQAETLNEFEAANLEDEVTEDNNENNANDDDIDVDDNDNNDENNDQQENPENMDLDSHQEVEAEIDFEKDECVTNETVEDEQVNAETAAGNNAITITMVF